MLWVMGSGKQFKEYPRYSARFTNDKVRPQSKKSGEDLVKELLSGMKKGGEHNRGV